MFDMRTDCTRDNQQVILPNASLLGYSTNRAKRGSWIVFEGESRLAAGRVVGRVHCEGKTYLEVIVTDAGLTMAYVRWIDPVCVRECYSQPHRRVFEFLMGEWRDPDTILRTACNGFVREEADA
jgi:hypothetical protein